MKSLIGREIRGREGDGGEGEERREGWVEGRREEGRAVARAGTKEGENLKSKQIPG